MADFLLFGVKPNIITIKPGVANGGLRSYRSLREPATTWRLAAAEAQNSEKK